ncbi:hypothetical protein BGX38DRAFT_1219385 [Terfezia claveryi]|nr:hypothetical protein BGX38DRAFT_1219385 [Terfezia claveryi]
MPPKPLPKRKGEAGQLAEKLGALNLATRNPMMERKSRPPASPPQNVQKKATPPRKTSPQLTPPVHYRHLAILPKQHLQSKQPPGMPAANTQDRTPGKKYVPCKTGLITASGMTGTR